MCSDNTSSQVGGSLISSDYFLKEGWEKLVPGEAHWEDFREFSITPLIDKTDTKALSGLQELSREDVLGETCPWDVCVVCVSLSVHSG